MAKRNSRDGKERMQEGTGKGKEKDEGQGRDRYWVGQGRV